MFAAKFAFIFALFSFCSAVVASPPACLLAAVNTQPKPGNLNRICGPKSEEVQRTIIKLCDSKEDAKEALKAFGSSCKDSGNQVSLIPVNPSSTGGGNGSGSGTGTGTATPTNTGSNPSPTSGGDDGPSDDSSSGSAEDPEDADSAAYVHGANTFSVAAVAALVGLAAAI